VGYNKMKFYQAPWCYRPNEFKYGNTCSKV